jgi:hypothetical protein
MPRIVAVALDRLASIPLNRDDSGRPPHRKSVTVVTFATVRVIHFVLSKRVSNLVARYDRQTFENRLLELMGDPRNVAHAKKVVQEKQHKHKDAAKDGATAQSGKKGQTDKQKQPAVAENATLKPEAAKPDKAPDPTQLEKSLAVLSNLKDLEFHSRANIEKLAELSLTIEEELKQKAFAEAIGAVYAAQDAFQSKILKLIEDYEEECAHLKPPG